MSEPQTALEQGQGAPAEAAPKIARPAVRTRRRPKRSPSAPAVSSSPAKTSRFFTHSCGRIALSAALTGPRRRCGASPDEGAGSLTAGLSMVVPSMMNAQG